MAERRAHNPEVAGSSPAPATNFISMYNVCEEIDIRVRYQGTEVRIKSECSTFVELIDVFRRVSVALSFSDDLWKEILEEGRKEDIKVIE